MLGQDFASLADGNRKDLWPHVRMAIMIYM